MTCTQVYITWIMRENLINPSWILLLLLEHIQGSIGYRSSFTKHLLYHRKEVELLFEQLFYLIERSRIIFFFCLGLFFFFPVPRLAWCLANFWHRDGSCLKLRVLKYHWCLWDHVLAHGKKTWRKISPWFFIVKVKSQELMQEWADLDWRSIWSRALSLTVPIIPQR